MSQPNPDPIATLVGQWLQFANNERKAGEKLSRAGQDWAARARRTAALTAESNARELSAALRTNADARDAKFEAHTKAVAEFLNDLYAIMVDPCAEGTINVAEMQTALLEAAKRDRQKWADADARPPQEKYWLCGCGAWNGFGLANCGMCSRPRSESDCTHQVEAGVPRRAEPQEPCWHDQSCAKWVEDAASVSLDDTKPCTCSGGRAEPSPEEPK